MTRVTKWDNLARWIRGSSSVKVNEDGDGGVTLSSTGGGGGSGTVTSVGITAPAAGIQVVSGSPVTTSGNIQLGLANDLAALEALSGTNTIPYRSGVDTWSSVTVGDGLDFSSGILSADSLPGFTLLDVSVSNTINPTVIGGTIITTSSGTTSNVHTIGSTNTWLARRRLRVETSAVTGNLANIRTNYTQWYFTSNAGTGGFVFKSRFGQTLNKNGATFFVGLTTSTAALTLSSSSTNCIGVGYIASDPSSGNFFFVRNDGAGTLQQVDLGSGAARGTTDGYELIMIAQPGSGSSLDVFVRNITTNTVLLDTTYTTELPALDTGLAFNCTTNNGAGAGASNIELEMAKILTYY